MSEFYFVLSFIVQWKLLNVISLGQKETASNNPTIAINGYLYIVNYSYVLQMGPLPSDHNKWLIAVILITLVAFIVSHFYVNREEVKIAFVYLSYFTITNIYLQFNFYHFFTVFTNFTGKFDLFYHFTGKFKTR